MDQAWTVNLNGQAYTTDLTTLRQWIAEGRVPPNAYVRKGELNWIPAHQAPELREVCAAAPPGAVPQSPPAKFQNLQQTLGRGKMKTIMTGLSGNEMFCLHQKGFTPGSLIIGNSVYSLGLLGSLGSSVQGLIGGEVSQVTNLIHEGRFQSYQRMVREAQAYGGVGITSVTSELRHFHGNIEFLSIASTVHRTTSAAGQLEFTMSGDGQDLYCLLDAGYQPLQFVFGNVAYSIGLGGGLMGGLRSLKRGEIREFSNVLNATRHLALDRIAGEARQAGANAVLGIQTSVKPFQGVHEMMMLGTAVFHPDLPAEFKQQPITSDLTCQETWNLANLGYIPLRLVLGTAVYSLGFVGGIMSALKSFARGEISELTSLIYEAREHAIGLIAAEAEQLGADDVMGIKTHVNDMNGLLEFLAIGTAVKRHPAAKTLSPALPPQAVMHDKDTWISESAPLSLQPKH
ncbi:MAG: heavy metal-binding domain-containing protein [Chloracidobacterium sp.]|nr:heavy metal-binding domain-containing protein [Chloracidobacterium validum]